MGRDLLDGSSARNAESGDIMAVQAGARLCGCLKGQSLKLGAFNLSQSFPRLSTEIRNDLPQASENSTIKSNRLVAPGISINTS